MTYDECIDIAWMWGFDFTMHIRVDGTVETTSGWAGATCIGHIFSNEQEALRSMMSMMESAVMFNIRQIEEEKC